NELLQRRNLRDVRVAVVADHVVASVPQPLGHVGAHASESDHADLHRSSYLSKCQRLGSISSSAFWGPREPAGYGRIGIGASRIGVTISHARSTSSARVNNV